MKKPLAFAFTALASAALFATTVTSDNTLGVMKLPMVAGQAEITFCLPWVNVGSSGSNAITVENILLTSNLADGDTIRVFYKDTDPGESEATEYSRTWEWDATNNEWDAMPVTVPDVSDPYNTPEADAVNLTRGQRGVTFTRASASGAFDLYVYGQYEAGAGTFTIPSPTTAGKQVCSIIAPPRAEPTELNRTAMWTTAPNVGDEILLLDAAGTKFRYIPSGASGAWATEEAVEKTTVGGQTDTFLDWVVKETTQIPAGLGAWYLCKGTTSPVIDWTKASSTKE